MLLRPRLVVACSLLISAAATAAPPPIPVIVPTRTQPVSYARDVAEILDGKCTGCHSSALAESKLNLEEVAGMLKGGKHGPAIVPGKADDSLLFRMAAHRVEPVMPPKDKKDQKPLTSEELGLLKLWIDAGARDDSAENRPAAQPIVLGALPPGVHPINAVDLTTDGTLVAAGRANLVQVYDVESGLEIIALGGHQDLIQSVRFSPDGRRLAAGSYQDVTVWNLPTGGLSQTFTGHGDQVKAVAVALDGQALYSGGLDNTIRVWNPADGKQVRQWNHPGQVLALAVSADGRTLLSGGSDNNIHVWTAADGKEKLTLKGHSAAIQDVAFLPGARRVVSASADGTARIWVLPGDEEIKAARSPNALKIAEPVLLTGHAGPVRALAVSPDGATIATGGDDHSIRLWTSADGKGTQTLSGATGPVLALAVSPDGKTLLAGSADKSARLYELESGKILRTLVGHRGPVVSVGFTPQGDRVVTAGGEGGLKVWDVATGQGVLAFGHPAPNNGPLPPLNRIAVAGDGSIVSASAGRTLKRWTVAGGWSERKRLGPHVFRVLAIDFSPDGKLIATGGGEPSRSGEVKLWDAATGALVRSLDALHSDTVFAVRFSPDGARLATTSADRFLKVVRVADGKELRSFEGHTHHVLAVDWKSDGKQLVTGGGDNVLKVWEFETGEQVRTLQPAGKQVTAVRWVAGKAEVVGASGDKLVRTWNPDNGGIARTYNGPSDYVFSVAVSKDGGRVAAGGADGVLFLWNGPNAQVLHKLEPPASTSPPLTKGGRGNTVQRTVVLGRGLTSDFLPPCGGGSRKYFASKASSLFERHCPPS